MTEEEKAEYLKRKFEASPNFNAERYEEMMQKKLEKQQENARTMTPEQVEAFKGLDTSNETFIYVVGKAIFGLMLMVLGYFLV